MKYSNYKLNLGRNFVIVSCGNPDIFEILEHDCFAKRCATADEESLTVSYIS